MAASLKEMTGKVVSIICADGKSIVGKLSGHDPLQNLILSDAHERVYSPDEPVAREPLGLYVVRGDNLVLVGELDEEEDGKRDFEGIRAEPMKAVDHAQL
ncbi:hypothetical protein TeGR_g10333 [Tetraparma gracilis]|uniref:U6 snRNA-associated Sm-like protein LSm8 n=1 Tax=Tetraparma gracilis TaxID=2962635 RepID=A0ABQ6MX80_9STRA|nr:hypothetical protein TeGR_g10333 [Tetraparma gracilis]